MTTTTMTRARDFLGRARDAERCVRVRLREVQHLTALAQRVTRVLGGVSGGRPGGREDATLRLVEAKERLEREMERLAVCKEEIRALIERLPGATQRDLLSLRYLSGMKWEEVAQTMCYTERQVYRIHKAALAEVELLLS